MTSKTITRCVADALEDLSAQDLQKFVHQLLDRRDEPRVRRNRVEGKSFLQITDVLESTFTEAGALRVAVEILGSIGCNREAERLVHETGGQSPKPDPSGDQHFVDKHRLALIQRVTNIAPILDELLHEGVIQQEVYDTIGALATSQGKMRALLSGPLKAARACKDAFYASLQRNEKYLTAELAGNKPTW